MNLMKDLFGPCESCWFLVHMLLFIYSVLESMQNIKWIYIYKILEDMI